MTRTRQYTTVANEKKDEENKPANENAKPNGNESSSKPSEEKDKKSEEKAIKVPYSNMPARIGVLIAGFTLTLIGFVAVGIGALFLFCGIKVGANPTVTDAAFFLVGTVLSFVGLIFTIAGANARKSMARLSFLFGLLAFLIGLGFAIVLLFFNTILPIEAFYRLGAK